ATPRTIVRRSTNNARNDSTVAGVEFNNYPETSNRLDDHGGHVVLLRRILGKLPDRGVKRIHQFPRRLAAIAADNVQRALDSKNGIVRSHGFVDAVRQEQYR